MTLSERIFDGIPVSPGIAIGKCHLVNRDALVSVEPQDIQSSEIEREVERFRAAVELSREQLERIRKHVADTIDEKHAEIYFAQSMFLEDAELVDRTIADIRAQCRNAEFVFHERISEYSKVLSRIDDPLFRARDADVLDIANRVIKNLLNPHAESHAGYAPDTVLLAHDLAPSETTPLIKDKVVAFVLEKGGPTSHTAIMAKALEIPAVVGVENVTVHAEEGCSVIVDGLTGRVVLNPSPETLRRHLEARRDYIEYERELEQLRDQPAETLDGYSIALRANLELPEEVEHVHEHGARGIGLFRTEFLFLSRSTPPTEDEQFAIYRQVAEQAKPSSVVLRTIDIGGDKFFSQVEISRELNPFMGQRAIRLCLQHPELFRVQLRAMLRASAFGRLRILIPMISGMEEFLEVKRHIKQLKSDLRRRKIPFDPKVEVGAMIEVPSAAVIADMLAREADFFSIGTNDLIQYSMAVDRGNEKVAYLYEPLHPAILRLIRSVIAAGHENGIPVCVCGEMAADPMVAIILIGMGIDELSMSSVSVPSVKKVIRSIHLTEAKVLVEEILGQSTIEGVKRLVERRLRSYVKQNKIHRRHLREALHTPGAETADE